MGRARRQVVDPPSAADIQVAPPVEQSSPRANAALESAKVKRANLENKGTKINQDMDSSDYSCDSEELLAMASIAVFAIVVAVVATLAFLFEWFWKRP
jgi:preprotein translocase subunit SecF